VSIARPRKSRREADELTVRCVFARLEDEELDVIARVRFAEV